MHYSHGFGGIVSITLNTRALKHWTLSHICSYMIKNVSAMGDRCESYKVITHKEETAAAKKADAMNGSKILNKLNICIDPLNTNTLVHVS